MTVDYLTKNRVDNKNIETMYRIENNHESIISKEMSELVQQERKRRFEIASGKNDDRRKYTNKYGFSGKLYCKKFGKTLKRRHWNVGIKSEKIIWQCNSYIEGKKNYSAKAIDYLLLKRAFIQLYNVNLFYCSVKKVFDISGISLNIIIICRNNITFWVR